MNALLQGIGDPQRRRFEEDLSARLEVLFRRCPALCGFTVQDEAPMPAHLTCHPAQNTEQAEEMLGEVAQMLLELVEERPEGVLLLHGRTFARTVH
jgi:hypothetical protein